MEIDVRTGKPLPNQRDLLGKTYSDPHGNVIEVVDVCSLFPTTHVVVEKKATGERWSVAAECIREIVG
ncbi:hypothetical protein [Desulfofundulus salinus]|uniref:hypothetical protein n=1 Tax=Desulfofundulus salinus TaxID=2419843 RepID=UPI000F65421D|nr:hypothetical protein [Desulfofundulus salinum]